MSEEFTYDSASPKTRFEDAAWRPTCYPWITYDAAPREEKCDEPQVVVIAPPSQKPESDSLR